MPTKDIKTKGAVVAPHRLAAEAGRGILSEGGSAIEAAVGAAAVLSVVYPHMCGLGGDAFWVIAEPHHPPVAIDGAGAAGQHLDLAFFRNLGLSRIPVRGALAAGTVAGALSSWQAALEIARKWGAEPNLERLLAPAIALAKEGIPATAHQAEAAKRHAADLAACPGFAAQFGQEAGAILKQPALARTLERLAQDGLDDFYRGALGRDIAADLARAGSPLVSDDLARHRPVRRRPLSIHLPRSDASLFAPPPPTQGLAALMALGLFERLKIDPADEFAFHHGLIEAIKQAYLVRNAQVTDPNHMKVHAVTYLSDSVLDKIAAQIHPRHAMPWPQGGGPADTVFVGIVDAEGRAVSLLQSLFHAFGSGLLLPETGILWHNRAQGFGLIPGGRNEIKPRRKPFHTLSPLIGKFRDGRVLALGTSGGDGQPQTLATIYARHALRGQSLDEAIAAPRWVLGRDWSGPANDLKLEARYEETLFEALRRAGHDVRKAAAFDPLMGQAGAVLLHPDGRCEAASDPRSDGAAAVL